MQIENGVFVLSMSGANSCCSHYSHDLKFKLRNGTFVLVGEELIESGQDVTLAKEPEYMSRKSVNYLSRQVIYYSTVEGKNASPAKTLLFHDDLLPLSEFSYYSYQDHFRSKELKRY